MLVNLGIVLQKEEDGLLILPREIIFVSKKIIRFPKHSYSLSCFSMSINYFSDCLLVLCTQIYAFCSLKSGFHRSEIHNQLVNHLLGLNYWPEVKDSCLPPYYLIFLGLNIVILKYFWIITICFSIYGRSKHLHKEPNIKSKICIS